MSRRFRPRAHRRMPEVKRWSHRLAFLLPFVLLTVACSTQQAPPPKTPATAQPPFADCAALATPPADPSNASSDDDSKSAIADRPDHDAGAVLLPEIELPCFTGGAPVALRDLRGPAVVNLWAAWCPPCIKELPAFQRLAERAGDQVHVIGVNTKDDRGAAQRLAEGLGLTFPALFDLDEKLLRALDAPPFIPLTLLIDEAGNIRHLDQSGALDDADLAAALEQHLGVVVPS